MDKLEARIRCLELSIEMVRWDSSIKLTLRNVLIVSISF